MSYGKSGFGTSPYGSDEEESSSEVLMEGISGMVCQYEVHSPLFATLAGSESLTALANVHYVLQATISDESKLRAGIPLPNLRVLPNPNPSTVPIEEPTLEFIHHWDVKKE